ncbi:peptidase M15 [Pseudonocardiaceae bacterium YIM PH 21723]|nr:peptidase M15 [Pseudonocardiaceae bacterium YIM PH 21723]
MQKLTLPALRGILIGIGLGAAVLFALPITPGAPGTPPSAAGAEAPAPPTGTSETRSDVDGPADGPRCSVDKQYFDKPTTGLDPAAAKAWADAVATAKGQGVTLCLNDGKRSAAQQLAEFQEQVQKYGRAQAERQVLPPEKSMHVKGLAVDVQSRAGMAWLENTEGALGWCRMYDNEPWHFEYRAEYRSEGCPARKPSALEAD